MGKKFLLGQYKDDYQPITYYASTVSLSKDLLRFGNDTNELVLQLFLFFETETRPVGKVEIASYEKLTGKVFLHDLLNLHFVRGAGLIGFILFFYFLFLFAVHKKKMSEIFFSV
jgi:hypothetical protein